MRRSTDYGFLDDHGGEPDATSADLAARRQHLEHAMRDVERRYAPLGRALRELAGKYLRARGDA